MAYSIAMSLLLVHSIRSYVFIILKRHMHPMNYTCHTEVLSVILKSSSQNCACDLCIISDTPANPLMHLFSTLTVCNDYLCLMITLVIQVLLQCY